MSAEVSPTLRFEAGTVVDRDGRLRRAVDEHYVFVWRTLRRYGVPEHEADDVAQEVFLLLSRKLETVEGGLEKRFLFRSAVHLAMHAKRAWRRRRTLEENAGEPEHDASPSAEDDAERRRSLALLDALLAELPEDLREVVVLCELEEMTMGEASGILGIPQGTVASRLRRARELLTTLTNRRKGNGRE